MIEECQPSFPLSENLTSVDLVYFLALVKGLSPLTAQAEMEYWLSLKPPEPSD